jgi:DNA helicase-2/ATP-dependent DNA helicase PcrA
MIGYGNALHHCLRNAAELIKEKGYNPVGAVVTSVENNFYLPFAGPQVFENAKKSAKQKLVLFVQKHIDDMMRIKEVESRIEFPIQRATIMGKVDVILHDNENLEIRDYKTSDTVISKEEAAMQVQLYTNGLKKIGEPVVKGSISYLEEAITESVDVDDATLKTTTAIAENYIKRILNRDFTPCPGTFCEKCNYLEICRYKK